MVFLCSSVFEDFYLDPIGTALLLVILGVMILTVVAVNVVPKLAHRWETVYETRDITYGAVCLALSYALGFIRLFSMPQGGSVTPAALAPLYLYCYYFGLRKGMIAAGAYTLLQFVQGAYVVSPWSAFYDYILPCFSICIVGLFRYDSEKYFAFVKKRGGRGRFMRAFGGHRKLFLGILIHTVVRYLSSALSGLLFYGDAGVSLSANLVYTFSYNSVLLVDSAVALGAVAALMLSRTFNMFMSSAFSKKKPAPESAVDEGVASDNAGEETVVSEQ